MALRMMTFDKPEYGQYYIVLAETNMEALDKLKGYMLSHISCFSDVYPQWKDATVDNLPDNFTIRVGACDVIIAEWA